MQVKFDLYQLLIEMYDIKSMLFHCKYAYVMQIRICEVAYGGMPEPWKLLNFLPAQPWVAYNQLLIYKKVYSACSLVIELILRCLAMVSSFNTRNIVYRKHVAENLEIFFGNF